MKSFRLIELGALASVLLLLGGCGPKEHGWSGQYELDLSSSAPAMFREQIEKAAGGASPALVIDEKAKTLKLLDYDLTIVSITDTGLSAEGKGAFLELFARIGGGEVKDSMVTIKFEKDAGGVYSLLKNGNRASAWKRIAGK